MKTSATVCIGFYSETLFLYKLCGITASEINSNS